MNPRIHSTRPLFAALAAAMLFATPLAADFDPSPIRVNQIGYLLDGVKIGVIVNASATPLNWEVRDASTNALVLSGQTTVYGNDAASGDHLHHADFTALAALGTYKLVVGSEESVAFDVAPNLYTDLPYEAMNYFYFHRLGMDVEKAHLADDRFDRAALHPGDVSIPPYSGWCSGCSNFDVFGSWAASTTCAPACRARTSEARTRESPCHPARQGDCRPTHHVHGCLGRDASMDTLPNGRRQGDCRPADRSNGCRQGDCRPTISPTAAVKAIVDRQIAPTAAVKAIVDRQSRLRLPWT